MHFQSLNGDWQFQQANSLEWMPAQVPGGVHTDLLANKRITDPFVVDNEKRVQWVAEADWIYQKVFSSSTELMAEDHIYLACDGLDTLATVYLNGHELGHTNNMFRHYEWEVRPFLKAEGENILTIFFVSAVKYIAAKNAVKEMPGPYHSLPGGPYIRKAPCQFGWDWGPQLPPIGIWKDIRLEGYSQARLAQVHLRQEHHAGQVTLEAHLDIKQWGNMPLSAILRVTTPQGKTLETSAPVTHEDETTIRLPIPESQLWYPNGYGEQPLYGVEVRLARSGLVQADLLDSKKFQVGLRRLELHQQADAWGRSFEFVVNGVRILAKGSNWIPADTFPTRLTEANLEGLISSAAETHQNMLRVWGGGLYEDERFYDLCDRYGILVWQEFIFSCSVYPLDDADFLENIHQEVIENIRRLRHRACLALWCGNNEMEWGWVDWNWDRSAFQNLKDVYDRFFHHILPEWCAAEDPDHAYWPSSPSSDTPFVDPNGQQQGDAHYWDVWHKGQPFTSYRKQYPRFMSEFGFQALPPLRTISTFADKADWNMSSYIMEQHQKNASGNSIMVRQMLDMFRLPKDFESLVYLSMALQAEGIRYGVEHWRRYPERIAGILYWQLNDCWPVASWSSLDYFGRWKALHYAARRFFAPIMLSIEDQPPEQAVYLSNDTLEPCSGTVRWSLETLNGEVLATGQEPATIAPQSAAQVCKLNFSAQLSDDNMRTLVFLAEFWQGNQLVSRQTAGFVPVKHLSLSDPGIQVTTHIEKDQLIIDLASQSLALLVEASLPDTDVVFSDNYFNLPAGRTARISCPLPAGWDVERVKKELRVRSVYDSYAN